MIGASIRVPADPAIVADGRVYDFATVERKVHEFRAALHGAGVRSGDRVALAGTVRAETAIAVFGLFESGVATALLHPRWTAAESAACAADAGVARTLDDAAVDALLREGLGHEAPHAVKPSPRDPFALVFTSGTSGRPKAAVLSYGAMVASARASEANLGWAPNDRWITSLPFAHVGGLSTLTRCFLAGKPVELHDRFDAPRVLASLRDGATLVSVVPSMLRGLLERDGANDLRRARAVLVGGAACAPDLLDECARRGVAAITTYGLTEMASQVATEPLVAHAPGESRGCGRALPGVELRIADGDGSTCAPGEIGTIGVRGPMRMDGYFGAAPLLRGAWFDTGDLGSLDPDGTLHVHARRTDLVVTGGENVYPVEVEQCLEAHPAIAAALVFGIPDPRWGQCVAAAVVLREDVQGDTWRDSLRAHLAARIARYKHPRSLAVVASIALLPGGKPDRAGAAGRYGSRLAPW